MARSEAQKRADKKYAESEKNNYTTISARITKAQAEKCRETAEKNGITVSKLAVLSILYCIENNIDFTEIGNKC